MMFIVVCLFKFLFVVVAVVVIVPVVVVAVVAVAVTVAVVLCCWLLPWATCCLPLLLGVTVDVIGIDCLPLLFVQQ